MYQIVLIITLFVHGHPNKTRHILPKQYSYASDCEADKRDLIIHKLKPLSKSTRVEGSCEVMDDVNA